MKRIIFALAVLASIPLLVLLLAFGWFTFFMDTDELKRQVAGQVREQTGRELSIAGDLELGLFPGLELRTGALRLESREGTGSEPMIEIGASRVALQWLALIRGEIMIDMIRLESPVLRLGMNAQGDSALGDIVARVRGAGGGEISDQQALGAGLAALAIQGLELSNGELHWLDERSGERLHMSAMNLGMERLSHREPGRLTLSGHLEDTAGAGSIDMNLSATIVADFESLDVDVSGLLLEIEAEPAHAALAVEHVRARRLAESPEILGSDLAMSVMLGEQNHELASPSARYSRDEGLLTVDSLSWFGPGVRAGGSMRVRELDSTPVARLEFATEQLDLVELSTRSGYGEGLLDPLGVSDASLSAEMELGANGLRVETFRLAAGRSDLSGRIEVGNFDAPILTASLRGSRLDVDSLLPGSPEGDGDAALSLAAPIELLRYLDGIIDIEIDELVAQGVELRDFLMQVEADSDAVSLEHFRASVSGGELVAAGRLGKQAPFESSVVFEIRDADAGDILGRLGLTDRLEGRGTVQLDLASMGLDPERLAGNLSGTVSIALVDGVAHGIDIARILEAARESSAGAATPGTSPEPPRTRFSSLTGSMRFEEGVGENRDLHLVAPEFHVLGQGKVSLIDSAMDYRLRVRVVRPEAESESEAGVSFEPVAIPLRIRGAVDDLSVSIDMETLLRDETRRRLEQEPVEPNSGAGGTREVLKDFLRRRLIESLD